MEKNFKIFTIFLQTKIQLIFFSTKKQKETTMKTSRKK